MPKIWGKQFQPQEFPRSGWKAEDVEKEKERKKEEKEKKRKRKKKEKKKLLLRLHDGRGERGCEAAESRCGADDAVGGGADLSRKDFGAVSVDCRVAGRDGKLAEQVETQTKHLHICEWETMGYVVINGGWKNTAKLSSGGRIPTPLG